MVGATLIAGAVLLAWGNSHTGPFVLDDHGSILGNPSIQHLWPPGWLRPPATIGETVSGRPVLNFTFAVNRALGGEAVRGYHVVNLLIHMLASLALWGILRRTPAIGGAAAALAAALIWAVHPLQTAAVTYVVQRAESLAALFALLCLYAFIRGASGGGGRWFVTSWACALLGVGTKETVAFVPLLVLLYDRTFIAGGFRAAWQARWRVHAALFVTWLPLGALVLANESRGGSVGSGVISAGTYFLTQCGAIMRYLRLSFWPAGQVFDYGTAVVSGFDVVVLPFAILSAFAAVTGWLLARNRPAGFAGATFFLLLAPSSSFIPVATQTVAEHRMYLPLAAVVALVCATAVSTGPRGRRIGLVATVAVVLALGGATFARNRVYQAELALWGDTVAKRPGNPRAQHNLGLALVHAGRPDEAMAAFRRAVALQPEHALAHFQLGTIHLTRRQWTEAAGDLQLAVAADPRHTAARVNLGQALGELGRIDEAIAQYEAALAIEPTAADVQTNLGAALIVRGRLGEAEQLLRAVLASAPGLAETHYHLGTLLVKKDVAVAEAEFAAAIRIKPEFPAAQFALGNLRARQQRFDEAMALYRDVLRLDPAHVQARNNLANCQLVTGRLVEAIANYEAVLRARPGDPTATRNLALAREQQR